MSMIEVNDMINELMYERLISCFWKSFKEALSNDVVRPLIIDFDVVNMVASMLRNHYMYVYLKDMVVLCGSNR